MQQRIDIADIAVNHVQAAIRQGAVNIWIEIDHADLIQQGFVLALDLAQQRAGGTEKPQDDDPPRFAVPALMTGIMGMTMIEIADADPLQRADGEPRDLVTAHDRECAQHRQDHKRK